MHFFSPEAYTVQSVFGGMDMESKDTTQWDVDDLIFGEEDGGASQR